MFDEKQIVSMFAPDFSVRYFDTLQNNEGKVIALYIAQLEEEIPVEMDDSICVTIGNRSGRQTTRLVIFCSKPGYSIKQIGRGLPGCA